MSLRVRQLTHAALGVALSTGARAEATVAPVARPAESQLESKAIDLLKATSARLAAARTMTFTAIVS